MANEKFYVECRHEHCPSTISPLNVEKVALQAGKIMLNQISDLIENKKQLCFLKPRFIKQTRIDYVNFNPQGKQMKKAAPAI